MTQVESKGWREVHYASNNKTGESISRSEKETDFQSKVPETEKLHKNKGRHKALYVYIPYSLKTHETTPDRAEKRNR